MEKVRILGGHSLIGRITVVSNEFISTATWQGNKDDEAVIKCEVQRRPKLNRWLERHPKLPIPKLVKLLAFFFSKARYVFLLITAVCVALVASKLGEPYRENLNRENVNYLLLVFEFGILPVVFWKFIRLVAPWHGAEHMVIRAYEDHESTDEDVISQQSIVDEKCGGRFALPILMAIAIAWICEHYLGWNLLMVELLLLEAVFWVDTLVGFENIEPFRTCSMWLQRYFTTKQPGPIEVATGRCAVLGLLAAHSALKKT